MDLANQGDPFAYHPLTPDRWSDFEALFGERGAYGGCWCMWWRIKRSEFERQQGEGNRQAMKAIVDSGRVPGILAYDGDQAVAWCSVAPREHFPVLRRSWVLKPIDDVPVWSVTCFYVAASHRQQGMMGRLLRAAARYVGAQGGDVLEGYPKDVGDQPLAPVSAFVGLVPVFAEGGFVECLRRTTTRPIMRLYLDRERR
ncbi:MAG: GNAT family N-acetyltransferase [Anaerolineae bacterium]|jgi:GNAT superfamily N-acetyltransferase